MKLSNFQDPHPSCPSTSKILPPPLTLDVQFQANSPSSNDNQSIKRKHNPRMNDYYMLSGPSFRSAFVFSINPLILYGFPSSSFHLAEASLSYLLLCDFTLLCEQLSENIKKYLLFIIIHILVLILQSTCFICTTWKRKQTMEQQPHRACERTKSKQKQNQVTSHSNWPRVLLFDLAHKQCNGIIKEWLHCLTSESNGRFLVNNILMFDSWCLVMAQI